ncbi:MAG: hypothetical protein RLZZ324_64 [Candidatus Parcubacteria bacterium]
MDIYSQNGTINCIAHHSELRRTGALLAGSTATKEGIDARKQAAAVALCFYTKGKLTIIMDEGTQGQLRPRQDIPLALAPSDITDAVCATLLRLVPRIDPLQGCNVQLIALAQ